MDPRDVNETTKATVNQGYRQGLVTAITVFLGFSLSFMRVWSSKIPATGVGGIYSPAVSSPLESGAAPRAIPISRSPTTKRRHKATVRYFFWGISIVIVGVVVAIVVAA